MRRKLIIGLALLNGLFAAALFALPAETQIVPRGLFDCCKQETPWNDYCCLRCCWFFPNCDGDEDC